MKKGLVKGFENTLKDKAAIKLNLKNLLNKITNGIPKPKVGKTLINMPIDAPEEISSTLALARASFIKNSFSFRAILIFSILI